jgi:hypothetical protein
MNKILPEMPALTSDVYAPVMPMWLANTLRLLSVTLAVYMAYLGYNEWSNMPTFAKVIICILSSAFFFFSLSSEKGWALYAKNPFFLADRSGMYFRHNQAFTTFIGNNNQDKKHKSQQWLFVPWSNIANIRVARVGSTTDGYSDAAAFDVIATAEEIRAFFDDDLKDKKPIQSGMQAVCFYQNMPPSPRKVVAQLQTMLNQYQKSPISEKYERAR